MMRQMFSERYKQLNDGDQDYETEAGLVLLGERRSGLKRGPMAKSPSERRRPATVV
jgi:hypothetical protein